MKIKLGTRIVFGFGFIMAIVLFLVYISLYNMKQIDIKMDEINTNSEKIKLVNIVKQAALTISKNTRGSIVFSEDRATLELEQKEVAEIRAEISKTLESLSEILLTAEEKELFQKYVDVMNVNKPINTQVANLIMAGKHDEASSLLATQGDPLMKDSLVRLNELISFIEKRNIEADKEAMQTLANSFSLLLLLGVVGIVLGLVSAYIIIRSITKPVNRIVDSLTEGANQVASASNQLSSSSQQLAEGSAEQSSSLQETSSTLEEAASMVQQNTENTKQAALLSEEVKDASNKGNGEIQEMTESMNEIKKSSDQISKIIKVIDDIAFQTNILALNAAVEAARAGEAGMGFAVVAEEVRNLAQRSAQAAKDTAGMIENNIELSEKGVNVTQKVRETLGEITTQAKKMSELMAEIAASSQEQSQGISQINKALVQMESVVQQNATNAEESASASEELSAQARNLKEMVQQLVILVHGKVNRKYKSLFRDEHTGYQVKQTSPVYHSTGAGQQVPQLQASMTHTPEKRTRLVAPEEVIPLEKDNKGF